MADQPTMNIVEGSASIEKPVLVRRATSKISMSSHNIFSKGRSRTLSESDKDGYRGDVCILQGYGNVAFYLNHNIPEGDSRSNRSDCDSIGYTSTVGDFDETTNIENVKRNSTLDLADDDSSGCKTTCSLNRYKGIALALLSAIMLSFNTLGVALLAGSVKSNEVVFAQMIFLLLVSVPVGTFQKVSFKLPRKAWMLVLYRSIMSATCTVLVFFAFQVMPIASAKAIIYSSPVFTALFSCLFFHEVCTAVEVLLSFFTLSGVLLVIQPPFIFGGDQTASTVLGPIFCLITAVAAGTIFIALRKIGFYRVPPMILLFSYSLVSITISGCVATILHEWVIPRCGSDRLLLILIGVFQFTAQVAIILATRYEKATTVSLIRTTDVFFTFVLEYIFFGTKPNAITILGATLIIGSLVGITLYQGWSAKKRIDKSADSQTGSDDSQHIIDDQ